MPKSQRCGGGSAAGHPVLRLHGRDPQGNLHDQRGGIAEYEHAQGLQTPRGFSSEEAALKVMYLAPRNLIRKWDRSVHWKAALDSFTLLWEEGIRAPSECNPVFFAPDGPR